MFRLERLLCFSLNFCLTFYYSAKCMWWFFIVVVARVRCCWQANLWQPIQMPPKEEGKKRAIRARRFEEFISRLAGYGGFSVLDIKMQNVFYILMWMLGRIERRECGKRWISGPLGPAKWSTHCRTLDTNENMPKERGKKEADGENDGLSIFVCRTVIFEIPLDWACLKIIPAGIHFWINQIFLAPCGQGWIFLGIFHS